jgi:hypothetical protein
MPQADDACSGTADGLWSSVEGEPPAQKPDAGTEGFVLLIPGILWAFSAGFTWGKGRLRANRA